MPFSVPNPLSRMVVPMIPLPGVFYPASLAVWDFEVIGVT